jgi:hypothetical protein
MLMMPPLGTKTSATIRSAHAKYKKTANTSHQSISHFYLSAISELEELRVALIIAFERQVEDFCTLARKPNQP